MTLQQIITRLHALADPEKIAVKERKFGIKAKNAFGIYQNDLKGLAKEIGCDNRLAIELFDTGIYEARKYCAAKFTIQSALPKNEWSNGR